MDWRQEMPLLTYQFLPIECVRMHNASASMTSSVWWKTLTNHDRLLQESSKTWKGFRLSGEYQARDG